MKQYSRKYKRKENAEDLENIKKLMRERAKTLRVYVRYMGLGLEEIKQSLQSEEREYLNFLSYFK